MNVFLVGVEWPGREALELSYIKINVFDTQLVFKTNRSRNCRSKTGSGVSCVGDYLLMSVAGMYYQRKILCQRTDERL